MDAHIPQLFVNYQQCKAQVEATDKREEARRALIQAGTLLKTILIQHQMLESKTVLESQDKSTLKQDLSKVQHEKKLLENKVALLSTEVQTWKKKSANQTNLNKENMQLKTQIAKLQSQVNETKTEASRVAQRMATQKAVLESKLENAKKNLKNLKESSTSPAKKASAESSRPTSPTKKPVSAIPRLAKEPMVSVSPFLSTRRAASPTRPTPAHQRLSQVESSTPVGVPLAKKLILAQSSPAFQSPLKALKNMFSAPRSSGLKNVVSPDESTGDAEVDTPASNNAPAAGSTAPARTGSTVSLPKAPKVTKPSLFDDDDEDDDDFFQTKVKKAPPKTTSTATSSSEADTTGAKNMKKRKKKLGANVVIEEDVDANGDVAFSPLKRVKLMDKLGGISPLKQRNQQRGLFKV